ncbi:hypothetical protein MtrunA17_Chr7g0216461 [Medicago truncatula]|uniref:Transmembrane protein n=1 Tax=Medicago truncatula TaxID=3880 RepID=A0A396GZV0_MEDTR|nr:hypothetical protein MtrunA17_Chr7g0216461 [Medicago truncatula]
MNLKMDILFSVLSILFVESSIFNLIVPLTTYLINLIYFTSLYKEEFYTNFKAFKICVSIS